MIENKKISVIIPARGGSKGIPHKNIVLINSKPLIYYGINAAKECKYVDEVFVSTEDLEIKETAKDLGSKVIDRPKELAEDHILTMPVILHFLDNITTDICICIQPTSPFITSKLLTEGIEKFINEKLNVILTVHDSTNVYFQIVNNEMKFIDQKFEEEYKKGGWLRRQDMDKIYLDCGMFYIWNAKELMNHKKRFYDRIDFVELTKIESIEIDNYEDLELVRKLIK